MIRIPGVAWLICLVCLGASNARAQADPSVVGQWGSVAPLPFYSTGIHLLPTGKVLFYGGDSAANPGSDPRIWDPATATSVSASKPGYDLFCSGHAYLADGKLFIAGGHISNAIGQPYASTYDAANDVWVRGPNMNAGRWYPTATTLANGDVLVLSGSIDTTLGTNSLPQVFQAGNGTWRDLTNAQLATDWYPWMHLAPNGRVFHSGPSRTTRYLDTSGTGAWTVVANRSVAGWSYGSSVMYEPGKVLVMGGGDPPTNTAEVIDLNAPSPSWRVVAPMAIGRRQIDATLLPDGKVLVTGGTSGPGFNNASTPVFAAEMWDPATESWTTMASAQTPRLYHSTALLLPDGRVFTSGGNNYPQVELYSPPYLFKGARPTITSAPVTVGYGQSFFVETPDAAGIAKVTWIRLGSVTHAFDMNQRINALGFSQAPGGLNVVPPSDPNLAPPGHYMLFILNASAVPSVARIVRLDGGGNRAPLVNAGADQTITLPASASLAGSASDDGLPNPPAALTTTWSKLSGPGTVMFANANALSTTASFSASGSYALRLTASDGAVASADELIVTVNSAPGEAGSGLTGQYYNSSGTVRFGTLVFTRTDPTVNFNWGTGSPGPGVGIDGFAVRWTGQVGAPVTGNYTFSTVSDDGVRLWVNGQLVIDNWTNHATTTNNSAPIALVAGTKYSIRMEFYEAGGAAVARLLWAYPGQAQTFIPQSQLFPASASPNQAPIVNAGADQTITLPASANLAGSASDDGQPNPPAALTTTWSKLSGPGTVTFGNANALSTTASFSASGSYALRLTANDGALASTDDVIVTVNQAPLVNAGADQTITLPASANLAGSASDDGPPEALTTTWSKLSGPGTVTFGNANALSTTASFSASGSYALRLTANDGALTSADDMIVTVNGAPGQAGSGLTGQYYNSSGTVRFGTLVFTRTDPTVNFNWGTGSPGPGVGIDGFAVRWTGQVAAPVTGNYTFSTVSDDGVRLWVNGQLVIDNWTNHATTTNNSAPIALVAGTKYSIRMEFYEAGGAAVARLLWAYPGQAQTFIPQSRLFP